MININNKIITELNTNNPRLARFVRLKNLLDVKMASFLRYLGTKNAVNRATDYHYLMLAVTDSTAPVNGIDYIHPSVKPMVDYATAVITKGLMPNGEVNFEFVPDNEADEVAGRQATEMVSHVINEMNDAHFIINRWVMDANMHKNGMMMIKPVREQVVRYVETQGTMDQLQAFEQQARDSGLVPMRQSRRRINVDLEAVQKEIHSGLAEHAQDRMDNHIQSAIDQLSAQDSEEESMTTAEDTTADDQQQLLNDAINRNTTYSAKYKLTGYNINIKFMPIAQHYWICDPTVPEIKDQPFCGFYDPMTIQEATELYPDIDLELFETHAEYNMNGAYQAGSVLNNLAIHARDSVPVMGIPVSSAASADPDSRQVSVVTVWNRYDIDGDGELELIEIVYSGSYIISAREVEFIPVANMCPKPLPGNFYGMSIGESVIPMQEYATAAMRAEIQLGLLTATPRLGVKPDRLDFEMLQDGEAAIFILDSKFDPATDVYQVPPPSGNLNFIEVGMNRMQQDTMAMIGMTTPQDTFNPEVMAPGNSGIKLQLALTPNQIIQDNTVRNSADGLKEAIWLVWRTLIQYGDEYGVKRLASLYHPDKKAEFLDYKSWDDMNFCERKQMHISLALGMNSEENALSRLQIIQQTQTGLYTTVQGMVQAGTLTPAMYKKVKKPFEDTLYVLGIKDCNTYLPSDEEVMEMIKQGQAAAKTKTPTPAEQVATSQAQLNSARAQEIQGNLNGQSPDAKLAIARAQELAVKSSPQSPTAQLDYMALAAGKPKVYHG
jgi:hypothetical protein